MNTTTQHVPGRLDHNRTNTGKWPVDQHWGCAVQHSSSGQARVGMYGRGTLQQLPHREVKWGNHEGRGHEQHFKGALNYNVKNMWQSCWLPRTRSSDRLVCAATNRHRVALFERRHWAKRDAEANRSCSPRSKENLCNIFYEERVGGHVLLIYSATPAQTDTRSPISKNEALWWITGT